MPVATADVVADVVIGGKRWMAGRKGRRTTKQQELLTSCDGSCYCTERVRFRVNCCRNGQFFFCWS